MKISIGNAIINPFALIGDNVKNFFRVGGIYAIIITVLSYLLGSSNACKANLAGELGLFCSNYGIGFFSFEVLKLFLIASFIKNWANVVFEKQNISLKPQKTDAKILFSVVGFLAIFALPLISMYFLYIRVPNPNWQIEVAYFLFVFTGIWAPFLCIRFFGIIGFIATKTKVPSVKEIWQKTKESNFRIIMFFMLFLMVFAIVLANFKNGLEQNGNELNVFRIIFLDIFYNIIFLLMLAIFTNHCMIMKNFIIGEK